MNNPVKYGNFGEYLESVFSERAKENQGQRTDIKQISAESKPIETRKELAKIANVSHDTIAKVKKIEAVASEEVKDRLNSKVTAR